MTAPTATTLPLQEALDLAREINAKRRDARATVIQQTRDTAVVDVVVKRSGERRRLRGADDWTRLEQELGR